MKKFILSLMLLSFSPAFADEIDDAQVICNRHLTDRPISGPISQRKLWQDGWDHCRLIAAAKIKRDADKAEEDEAKNPALKKTRDLSKKLLNGEVK